MSMDDHPAAHIPVHPVLWIRIAAMIGFEVMFAAANAGLVPESLGRWPVYLHLAFFDLAFEYMRAGNPIEPGFLWPLLTHAFLHGGWLHLAMNGAAFLGLGHALVQMIGIGRFLVIFVVTAIAGALIFGLIADANGPLVGASGAIFGMLAVLTAWQDPAGLKDATRQVAAAFLACGLDPKRSILFNQSQVPAHAELAWVFNCVVRLGWLSRMTHFKDKAGKNRENSSAGLYVYPALMAADILAYRATHVPVGEDQKQHLELARDIAAKFNNDFGAPDFFPLPEPLIGGPAPRVMSLRDGSKKMSKSDPSDMSRINMTDDADTIAAKIRKARTDPQPLPETVEGLEARPEARNLVGIYAALAGNGVSVVGQRRCPNPIPRI